MAPTVIGDTQGKAFNLLNMDKHNKMYFGQLTPVQKKSKRKRKKEKRREERRERIQKQKEKERKIRSQKRRVGTGVGFCNDAKRPKTIAIILHFHKLVKFVRNRFTNRFPRSREKVASS